MYKKITTKSQKAITFYHNARQKARYMKDTAYKDAGMRK